MAKQKEEKPAQPTTITYMLTDMALAYVDKLIDCLEQPYNGVRARVKHDGLIISFDRELSVDEVFYLGVLMGKLEQRIMLENTH